MKGELSAITSKDCIEGSKSLNEHSSLRAGLEKMNIISTEQNQRPGNVNGTNAKGIERQENRGSIREITSGKM